MALPCKSRFYIPLFEQKRGIVGGIETYSLCACSFYLAMWKNNLKSKIVLISVSFKTCLFVFTGVLFFSIYKPKHKIDLIWLIVNIMDGDWKTIVETIHKQCKVKVSYKPQTSQSFAPRTVTYLTKWIVFGLDQLNNKINIDICCFGKQFVIEVTTWSSMNCNWCLFYRVTLESIIVFKYTCCTIDNKV